MMGEECRKSWLGQLLTHFSTATILIMAVFFKRQLIPTFQLLHGYETMFLPGANKIKLVLIRLDMG